MLLKAIRGKIAVFLACCVGHDKQIETLCAARNASGATTVSNIDLAIALLRRGRELERAEQLLIEARQKEMTVLEKTGLIYAGSMVALERGDYAEAEQQLRETLQRIEASARQRDLYGMEMEARARLGLALAANGKTTKAEELLSEAEPFLRATGEQELAARCSAMIATRRGHV